MNGSQKRVCARASVRATDIFDRTATGGQDSVTIHLNARWLDAEERCLRKVFFACATASCALSGVGAGSTLEPQTRGREVSRASRQAGRAARTRLGGGEKITPSY